MFIDIEDFDESNEDGIIDKLLYDDEKIENWEEDIKLKDYTLAELYKSTD